MDKPQMIELLVRDLSMQGTCPVRARARIERWRAAALRRELLLRGLIDYDADDGNAVPAEDCWEQDGMIEAPVIASGRDARLFD